MTEGSVDAEVIKKTQDSLGKYVKKPPLTEKLLRKPPFKFILDIVKAVIRDTHFLEDLYTDDELNAEKDRDGKMKFLQKLIDCLKMVTQKDLQVKTSKIVAGLEVDKTNELFQAIAYAIDNNLDSKEAVNAVKSGATNQTKTKATKNEKISGKTVITKVNKTQPPSRDSSNQRITTKPDAKKQLPSQKSIEKKTSEKPKDKSSTKAKPSDKKLKKIPSKEIVEVIQSEPPPAKIEEKVLTNGSLEHQNSTPPKQNSATPKQNSATTKLNSATPSRQSSVEKNEETTTTPANISNPQEPQQDEEKKEIEEPKVNGDVIHNDVNVNDVNHQAIEVEKETEILKPQDELAAIIDEEAEYRRKEKTTKKLSTRHRQKSVEDANHEKNQEVPQQPQPPPQEISQNRDRFQSSYKRESFDRPRTSLRPPSARPASSRPAAPRRRDKNIEIVLQPDENMKLANINIKMENFSKELEDDGENLVIIEDPSASNDSFINERLTKNLSNDSNEATAADDHGHLVQQILETEKNFEGALGLNGSDQMKKTEIEFDETRNQSNIKQMETLKDLLQKLVRSLNPIGNLMNFVQEDIDSMQREYIKWDEMYKQSSIDLKREQNETQVAIEPLKFQLAQLEKSIIEHHEMIDQLRGNLMTNENKINKIFHDI